MSPKPASAVTTPSATKRPAPPHATALRRPTATTHAPPRSVARWHPTNRRQMAPHKRHPLKGVFGAKNAICATQKAFSGEKTPFDRCHLQHAICKMPFEKLPSGRHHTKGFTQKSPVKRFLWGQVNLLQPGRRFVWGQRNLLTGTRCANPSRNRLLGQKVRPRSRPAG